MPAKTWRCIFLDALYHGLLRAKTVRIHCSTRTQNWSGTRHLHHSQSRARRGVLRTPKAKHIYTRERERGTFCTCWFHSAVKYASSCEFWWAPPPPECSQYCRRDQSRTSSLPWCGYLQGRHTKMQNGITKPIGGIVTNTGRIATFGMHERKDLVDLWTNYFTNRSISRE